MSVFKQVDPAIDFPAAEADVLAFWKERGVFAAQREANSPEGCARAGREHHPYVFYEGPPTANGIPHPGHVLTRVIKDVVLRYKAMQGHDVLRKAGWDTHGLPVEIEVEKTLGIEGKEGIEAYGVEPFVRMCRESVFQYADLWTKMTERIGFWLDLDDPYVTYHQEYIQSVWWALKTFYDAGLLYHGHKVVPYCPRCGTALSSHEVGQAYKETSDPSLYVAFHVKGEDGLRLLAWTTTPWTLLSNVALAVGVEYDYDYVKVGDEILVVASALREACFGKIPHEVVNTVKGAELVGLAYEPLFDYASPETPVWRVVRADFVGLETGSGIVHMAPAFGEDDYRVAMENDLPVINLVEPDGTFSEAAGPWAGTFVKEADKAIIKALRERGQVLKAEQVTHDYPFCWRCDSPLIYYARPAWYIRTTEIRERMLANNAEIDWHPEHIRDGRFGNFLESNIDWALSRERYWGTPLPIWHCHACGWEEAIGSLAELREKTDGGDPGEIELHRPYVDAIRLTCPKCSSVMVRVPEVIDCWFDSGSMPFAQWGYPHAEGSAGRLEEALPADFITEAIDQTRGWFYTLLAVATLLKACAEKKRDASEPVGDLEPFREAEFPLPYRRCLVLGHVCDEDGYKMSKSKGNYLDPWEILNENGADALRWYFFSSNYPWVQVRFTKSAVRDAQKEFLLRLRNVYQFFTIYANIDGFDPRAEGSAPPATLSPASLSGLPGCVPLSERPLLDRWIRSKLATTARAVEANLEALDILSACRALEGFVDALSNWYVRRSRDRFWAGEKTEDKWAAYWTLYECLGELSVRIAPFAPFLAEEIYRALGPALFETLPESVHLHPWSASDEAALDEAVERQMDLVREIASLGHGARASEKLKVRQPLGRAVVVLADPAARPGAEELSGVIRDELNVKALEFAEEAETYVQYEIKLNFKALGPRLGKRVKACAKAVAQLDGAEVVRTLEAGKPLLVDLDGETVELGRDDVEIRIHSREGFTASQGRDCVVVLDTTITPELEDEGFAREIVSRIQSLRKELDLPYEARIRVRLDGDERLRAVAEEHRESIAGETLCAEFDVATPGPGTVREFEVDGQRLAVSLEPVEG